MIVNWELFFKHHWNVYLKREGNMSLFYIQLPFKDEACLSSFVASGYLHVFHFGTSNMHWMLWPQESVYKCWLILTADSKRNSEFNTTKGSIYSPILWCTTQCSVIIKLNFTSSHSLLLFFCALYTTLKFWCSIIHSWSLPFFGHMPGCRSQWDQSRNSKQLTYKYFSSIGEWDYMILFTL